MLDATLRLKADPRLRFAGQITGVEGYVESAAIGLLTGRFAAAERLGHAIVPPPATTALGALLIHITGGHLGVPAEPGTAPRSFQPMNINFGLIPVTEAPSHDADGKKIKGKDRGFAKKRATARKAIADLTAWLEGEAGARKVAAE